VVPSGLIILCAHQCILLTLDTFDHVIYLFSPFFWMEVGAAMCGPCWVQGWVSRLLLKLAPLAGILSCHSTRSLGP